MTDLVAQRCDSPEAWNQLTQNVLGSGLFHRFEWGRLMELLSVVRFDPHVVRDGDRTYALPVFHQNGTTAWSLLGYGGPALGDAPPIAFQRLSEAMANSTGTRPCRVALPCPAAAVFSDVEQTPGWQSRTTHVLDLPATAEALARAIHGNARTGSQYGPRRGVVMRDLQPEDQTAFYEMYLAQNERLHAAYTLPDSLFEEIDRQLPEGTLLRLGAFLDGALIAASLFLLDRETMYHWVHVSDQVGKRMQASYCLLHRGLTQAMARGIRRVDMGSSHTPEIARPKERWGATPRELGWYGL